MDISYVLAMKNMEVACFPSSSAMDCPTFVRVGPGVGRLADMVVTGTSDDDCPSEPVGVPIFDANVHISRVPLAHFRDDSSGT